MAVTLAPGYMDQFEDRRFLTHYISTRNVDGEWVDRAFCHGKKADALTPSWGLVSCVECIERWSLHMSGTRR